MHRHRTSRSTRKTLRFALNFGLVLTFSLALIGARLPVQTSVSTATIVVNTLDDELNTDGDCSLREAITAANENTGVDACTPGSGTAEDTIQFNLPGDSTLTLNSQLPAVTSSGAVWIDGDNHITISGNSNDRLFVIDPDAHLTLQNLALTDGYAGCCDGFGQPYNGGAIENAGHLTLQHVALQNNAAEGKGGAIFNDAGTLAITASNLSNNISNFGGAIASVGGSVSIDTTTFDLNHFSNMDTGYGGAIYNESNLTLKDSTLSNNTASYSGGGLYVGMSGSAAITNTTFSENAANWLMGSGGAITSSSSNVSITNGTLDHNHASFSGSAILSSLNSVSLHNTIVAGDVTTANCSGTIIDIGYNLDSGHSCGFNSANQSLSDTDPTLSPLADYGGPTLTHALLAGSPAISNIPLAECPATDQRGYLRIGLCDIGAYESDGRLPSNFSVNTEADSHDADQGDGICADTSGECSLRAAIEEANILYGLDTITLPDHTYNLSLGQLVISDSLTVNGPSLSSSVISGQQADRVLKVDKPGGSQQIHVKLNHLTLQDGAALDEGGGVWNDEVLELEQAVIQHNTAGQNGGGIFNTGGIITMTASTVYSNTLTMRSFGGGVGIYTSYGTVLLTDTDILENTCPETSACSGGGIYNSNSNLFLVRSQVLNNHIATNILGSVTAGAGISNNNASLTLIDSSVNNNRASGEGFMISTSGGGINSFVGEVSIEDSDISRNQTSGGGGGLDLSSSKVTIANSTIQANSAVTGGGIQMDGSVAELSIETSSVISNTATDFGGGIYDYYGKLTFTNSTVSANTAVGYAGEMLIAADVAVTVTHSTISGNDMVVPSTGDNGAFQIRDTILDATCSGALQSGGYNLISAKSTCDIDPLVTDLIDEDPLLAPLADNGGPTLTKALLEGSPAIDTGTCNDFNDQPILTDQRGVARSNPCDIGAYEYENGVLIVPTTTSLETNRNPSYVGETVVLTATVTSVNNAQIPVGSVEFFDQNQSIAVVPLDGNGQAVLSLDDLTPGVHPIKATFSENLPFTASYSPVLNQVILPRSIFLPIISRP